MASKPFSPFASTAKPKVVKTRDALDVAARYFVYKLYTTPRVEIGPNGPLKGIDESQVTIGRAVVLGWAVLQRRPGASLRQSEAALTDEGRRLARMVR
jgi:hypothetical protein